MISRSFANLNSPSRSKVTTESRYSSVSKHLSTAQYIQACVFLADGLNAIEAY